MKSGRLYSLVTTYWPRIAAGLVVVIGLLEFVVGGLTADSGLEVYLMAWAGLTGGLWFLFEKAESSLSEEMRHGVIDWLRSEDIQARAWAIPISLPPSLIWCSPIVTGPGSAFTDPVSLQLAQLSRSWG